MMSTCCAPGAARWCAGHEVRAPSTIGTWRAGVNAGVSEALFISESAVEKHVSSIFLKLGVTEQPQISRRVAAVLTFLGTASPADT